MYRRPRLKSSTCAGVSANSPETLPFVALVTTRSSTPGPRIPLGATCTRAVVAGVCRPSKVPVTVKVVPLSVPVAEPDPVRLAAVEACTGTEDSRTLYVEAVACATTARPPLVTATTTRRAEADRVSVIVLGALEAYVQAA